MVTTALELQARVSHHHQYTHTIGKVQTTKNKNNITTEPRARKTNNRNFLLVSHEQHTFALRGLQSMGKGIMAALRGTAQNRKKRHENVKSRRVMRKQNGVERKG
jgi:hypothetical protein